MNIGGRKVGPEQPPLIISEIGINHGGCLDTAKGMVLQVARAGGQIVKHQTHFVEDEMTDEAKFVIPPNDERSIWQIMKDCALSPDDEVALKKYAEGLGLIYISTPFSRSAADFLDDINVPAFKIGSGECTNFPLVEHIASKGRPIIMSTGMQSIEDLESSVNILRNSGVPFALLECTNLYPSPPSEVSLSGVIELREAFPDAIVGFSDHSIGPTMALASIGLGAQIIERHFTDTRYREGPDIICSMDGPELSFILARSEEIWTSMRNKKQRSQAEESVYRFARGSVVADSDIKKGQVLCESDIWMRRPGTGDFGPKDFYGLLGKTATIDIKRNSQIKKGDVI